MFAGTYQGRSPARADLPRRALHTTNRHPWRTRDYGPVIRWTQARRQLGDEVSGKVSRLAGGWARIVWDLLRALRAAKLKPLEHVLFLQAIEESWRAPSLSGGGEALPFRLNLLELSRVIECDRRRLGEALRRLVRMGLLVPLADELLSINKDYRTWKTMDGAPLLSPAQVSWAVSISKTASGLRQAQSVQIAHPLTNCTAQDANDCNDIGARRPESLASCAPSGVSPQTPIEEARASEEFRKNLLLSSRGREDSLDPIPDADLFPIHDGPHAPTEAEARETLRLARSLLPGNSIAEEVWQAQRLASPAVWRAAIREAARAQPSGVRLFRYVLAIASRFEAEGIPTVSLPAPRDEPTQARRSSSEASLERQRAIIAQRRAQAQEATNGHS